MDNMQEDFTSICCLLKYNNGNSHISVEEYSGALILVPSFSLQQNSSSIWTPG